MKTFHSISIKFGATIIFLSIFASTYAQSSWKHVKENIDPSDFSVLVYLGCTEDLSGNTYCVGINVNDEFENESLFNPFVASLSQNGNIQVVRQELKSKYGFLHIAQIPNTETFYTLSISLLDRSILSTVWDYDLNIVSEEIVETGAKADIIGFEFKHTKLRNGNLLFVTNGEDGSDDYALFAEVNPSGKIVKTKVTYLDFCATVVENPNGMGYYCIGDHAIELDSSFDVVQELGFVDVTGEYHYGTTALPVGSNILVNYISIDEFPELTLFDKDLNVIKTVTKEIESTVEGFLYNSLAISASNDIFTAHIVYLDDEFRNKSSIVLTKYDADLNQIWESIIDDPTMSLNGAQIALTNEGGIIITGYGGILEFDFQDDYTNAFVIKLDGNGMLSQLNEIESDVVTTTVYPNPSSGELNIMLRNMKEKATLKLIDVMGKTVVQQVIGSEVNTLDFSTIANGIYHYQIISNDRTMATGKWVKIK